MLEDSDEGQRLRTSHPFVGVLTQEECESLYDFDWDALKREYEQRTRRPWPTSREMVLKQFGPPPPTAIAIQTERTGPHPGGPTSMSSAVSPQPLRERRPAGGMTAMGAAAGCERDGAQAKRDLQKSRSTTKAQPRRMHPSRRYGRLGWPGP